MSQSSGQQQLNVIVADTNVAYILYFFINCGIVPKQNIQLPSGDVLIFHPIVKKEAQAHFDAWVKMRALGRKGNCPAFLDMIQEDGMARVLEFIDANMHGSVSAVDTNSRDFVNKRTIYEGERVRLQAGWKSVGVQGRKTKSTPSINDYSVLYSAESLGYKIATSDEILVSLSKEFLDEGFTFYPEEIIKQLNNGDAQFSDKVNEVADTLSNLKIAFVISRVFSQ